MYRLTISIFLIICTTLQAESYHKLIEGPDKFWDIGWTDKRDVCPYSSFPARVFMDGDTIINGIAYTKTYYYLYKSTYPENWHCPPFTIDTVPHLDSKFIREDTINRLIYIYDKFEQSEYLLFDFSLEVGDTLKLKKSAIFDYAIIDSIDFIYTEDGKKRKRFLTTLRYGFQSCYIEGIGGLSPFELQYPAFEGSYSITMNIYQGCNIILQGEGSYDLVTDPICPKAYHPMLTSGKTWYVGENYDSDNFNRQTIFQVIKDTTINGKTYQYLGTNFLGEKVILREDIENKKVYRVSANGSGDECLLYDFDVKIGDTIETCEGQVVINHVGIYGNKSRDLIISYRNKESDYNTFYYESIGNHKAFGSTIMCVKINQENYFGHHCDDVTNASKIIADNFNFTIYPNPTSGPIHISTDNKSLHIRKIIVYDILGNSVIEKLGYSNENTLNIASLTSGLYYLKCILSENTVFVKPIFKNN